MLCGVLDRIFGHGFGRRDHGGDRHGNRNRNSRRDKADQYLTDVYETPEAKLANSKRKLKKGDYELYSDETSGEVAVRNVTDRSYFTNPTTSAPTTRQIPSSTRLLSRIIIKCTGNGKENSATMKYASMRDESPSKHQERYRVGTSSDGLHLSAIWRNTTPVKLLLCWVLQCG